MTTVVATADRVSLFRRNAALIVALLAVSASITGLGNGFALDDMHIIADNARVHTLARLWEVFGQTYWPSDHGGALYRPMTILMFALEWAVGGGSPLPFHIANIAVYAAACVAFYRMAIELVPADTALLAAALFAVHPVHTEAVANVVGQPEMFVALFMFIAVRRYVRARRSGGPGWRDIAFIASTYFVACLFKEHAIVLPGLLIATEVVIASTSQRRWDRTRRVAPMFGWLAVVTIAFVAVRTLVAGGVAAGTNELLSGAPFDVRALTMLGIVVEWLRLFLWPVNLSADYSFPRTRPITALTPELIPVLLLLVLAVWIAWRVRKTNPVATFAFLWVGVAMAIPSNVIIPTGFVLAERTLFLATAGMMLLVAIGLATIWDAIPIHKKSARIAVACVLAAFIVAGVMRSSTRNPAWRSNMSLVRQTVEDVPISARAHWMLAEQLEKVGEEDESVVEMLLAVRLGGQDDFILLSYAADLLYKAGRYGGAYPLYERALALTPRNEALRSNMALCLIRLGRTKEARDLALAGLIREKPLERLTETAALADSLLNARIADT